MTKRRAPLTYDNALVRIAALLGWSAMATATGRQERTVRNWSDPDTGESCPIDCAEQLDLAYRAAGGEGAPMLECLAQRIDAACADVFADEAALSRSAEAIAKEGGEAISAVIRASRPGATDAERRDALRETEELAAEITRTLPLLSRKLSGGSVQ